MSRGRDFWSRRRAGVEAETQAEQLAVAEAELAQLEDRPDEELLAEANQPDPDTLDSPEAVQEFLRAQLPQRLKTRALRRLWRLNPMLANLDGLVDYGEDFTDSATVLENMQTVYQVGKGMLTAFADDDEADEADIAEDEMTQDVAQASDTLNDDPQRAQADDAADDPNPEDEMAEAAPFVTPAEPDAIAQPQRRMRFAYVDA
ncbi:DUF3306 domain-containing protein [Nereida sp. MMG025]|uniref:DUF3306 domain-containing protein n=1 Tax=Nereida sp. MMG025 TaxID=2909981 RepID=UPI001F19D436|nr:DUF3306 domain-containing protein [Nereida sp. MMG025]MCF6444232.1 DUF3306 domain-containing protein [Nereida sp. MMG025]